MRQISSKTAPLVARAIVEKNRGPHTPHALSFVFTELVFTVGNYGHQQVTHATAMHKGRLGETLTLPQ